MFLLQFPVLKKFPVQHGTFLRQGGVSNGCFSSLNFGLSTGDDKESVLLNHRLGLNAISASEYVYLNQIHSNIILEVNSKNYISIKGREGDGLITNDANLTLVIFHADCQATIIYDPVQHVIANIHAGWKGQIIKNIYKTAIKTLVYYYNSSPKNLIVCVSPSLGPEHSEMLNTPDVLYKNFKHHMFKPYYFNFWNIAKEQLVSTGISEHNVHIAEICTFNNPEYFYSYRRDGTTGRHATIISLLPL